MLLLEVSTLQGPEMHLDVPRQQEPVLLLEVSTLQGPEMHLDVPRQQKPVLLLDVSTLQGPQLHRDMFVQQEPACAAPGHFYTTGALSCTWTYSDNRSLCCFWTCLNYVQEPVLLLDLQYLYYRGMF